MVRNLGDGCGSFGLMMLTIMTGTTGPVDLSTTPSANSAARVVVHGRRRRKRSTSVARGSLRPQDLIADEDVEQAGQLVRGGPDHWAPGQACPN